MEKTTLTDGSPVTPDHRELRPNGQQKGYVVLSEEERSKGYIEPVRTKYVHIKCGAVTIMASSIAETYARDPYFYGGTFCVACGAHFPVGPRENGGEFLWDGTDQEVGTTQKAPAPEPTPRPVSVEKPARRPNDLAVRVADLEKDVAGLVEALSEAASWFYEYELLHRLKSTEEGNAKADANARKRDYCQAAIDAVTR